MDLPGRNCNSTTVADSTSTTLSDANASIAGLRAVTAA
jgi:hypothetical protein